ncbi:MAG TPA: enoyl-[acyl-carrier-protein] reductase FabK [Clostridiaceae bacterium]|nr:enoyl-[acyl-carrier-protein] reductase FabK [Clostridiaceae bacterium]
MWLSEKFNLKYPVISGGMANISTAVFAAAVSNAGALGMIGTGAWTADQVRAEIRKARELTDKPFGVNLMLMNPHSEEVSDVVVEEGIKVVTTGAGNPAPYIDKWHEAGISVIPVISSLSQGERMQKLGVDAVVGEGQEAGGHIGDSTSMILWPLLAKNLDIPVIGAGGVALGSHIIAGRVLGVQGFQLGTLLLSAEECPIHDGFREQLLKARDSQITVVGRAGGGMPTRIMKNPLARKYIQFEKENRPKEDYEQIMNGALKKAVFYGDKNEGCFMMGLVASLIDEIKPMEKVLADLFAEAEAEYARIKTEDILA